MRATSFSARGDYTQLTGRAGRRGIDTQGFGVVLHSPFVRFRQVTEIASIGAHELRSSFRPTYNMTANLIANYPRDEAETLLEASFAAFQRSEDMADNAGTIEALEHQLRKEQDQAVCEKGDVSEYLIAVEAAGPSRRQDGIKSVLGPGAVVDVRGGSRDGRYAVLRRLGSKGGGLDIWCSRRRVAYPRLATSRYRTPAGWPVRSNCRTPSSPGTVVSSKKLFVVCARCPRTLAIGSPGPTWLLSTR